MATTGRPHTILVATDLTEDSRGALRAAADLGLASGARVRVVHAHEEFARNGEILAEQREIHAKRVALLNTVSAIFPRTVPLAGVHVRIGSPSEVILREAGDIGADLIILGAHRKRGFADRILGSTAEAVVRETRVPCLILNGPLRLPVEHMVVPTDFSLPARQAAIAALGWASVVMRRDEGRITLTHMFTAVEDADFSWAGTQVEADLRAEANEVLRANASPVAFEVRLLVGRDASEEVLRYAEATETGMIVLGTHGDSPVVRTLLGSVSSTMVRRAEVPLLLIPRPATVAKEKPRRARTHRSVREPAIL